MIATLRERAEHAARYGANLVVPAREIKQLLDELDTLRRANSAGKLARAVAAVTPCTCSAQRGRADRAENQLRAVRTLADTWANPAPGLSPGAQLITLGAAALIYRALSAPAHAERGDQR